MRYSLSFLARFVVWAGLMYGVWEVLAPFYLTLVAPVVDALFAGLHLPVLLEQRGGVLLLVYRQGEELIRLQAHGYDVVYLNLIAAIALVAATPARSIRWRIGWSCALLVLLWFTHVACFFAEGQIAIWRYLDTLFPGPGKERLVEQVQLFFPSERRDWFSLVLDRWNVWGRYGVVVGIWFFALRREIGRWARWGYERSDVSEGEVLGSPSWQAVDPRCQARNGRLRKAS